MKLVTSRVYKHCWVISEIWKTIMYVNFRALRLKQPLTLVSKLSMILASTVILGSGYCGTHNHTFLSQDSRSHATAVDP
jgi:hypothetical protein